MAKRYMGVFLTGAILGISLTRELAASQGSSVRKNEITPAGNVLNTYLANQWVTQDLLTMFSVLAKDTKSRLCEFLEKYSVKQGDGVTFKQGSPLINTLVVQPVDFQPVRRMQILLSAAKKDPNSDQLKKSLIQNKFLVCPNPERPGNRPLAVLLQENMRELLSDIDRVYGGRQVIVAEKRALDLNKMIDVTRERLEALFSGDPELEKWYQEQEERINVGSSDPGQHKLPSVLNDSMTVKDGFNSVINQYACSLYTALQDIINCQDIPDNKKYAIEKLLQLSAIEDIIEKFDHDREYIIGIVEQAGRGGLSYQACRNLFGAPNSPVSLSEQLQVILQRLNSLKSLYMPKKTELEPGEIDWEELEAHARFDERLKGPFLKTKKSQPIGEQPRVPESGMSKEGESKQLVNKPLVTEDKEQVLEWEMPEERSAAPLSVPPTVVQSVVANPKILQGVIQLPKESGCIRLEIKDERLQSPLYNMVHYTAPAQGQSKACGFFAIANAAAIHDLVKQGKEINSTTIAEASEKYKKIQNDGLAVQQEALFEELDETIKRYKATGLLAQALSLKICSLNLEKRGEFVIEHSTEKLIGFGEKGGKLERVPEYSLLLVKNWVKNALQKNTVQDIHFILFKPSQMSGSSFSGHYVLFSLIIDPRKNDLNMIYTDAKNGPLTKDNAVILQINTLYMLVKEAYAEAQKPFPQIEYSCPINVDEVVTSFQGIIKEERAVERNVSFINRFIETYLRGMIKDNGPDFAKVFVDELYARRLITPEEQARCHAYIVAQQAPSSVSLPK